VRPGTARKTAGQIQSGVRRPAPDIRSSPPVRPPVAGEPGGRPRAVGPARTVGGREGPPQRIRAGASRIGRRESDLQGAGLRPQPALPRGPILLARWAVDSRLVLMLSPSVSREQWNWYKNEPTPFSPRP
jgi:hypothetical protein